MPEEVQRREPTFPEILQPLIPVAVQLLQNQSDDIQRRTEVQQMQLELQDQENQRNHKYLMTCLDFEKIKLQSEEKRRFQQILLSVCAILIVLGFSSWMAILGKENLATGALIALVPLVQALLNQNSKMTKSDANPQPSDQDQN